MKTVELFAGIGGFRIAADSRGFETIWANDNCSKACAVYRDRFGPKELREGDIRTLFGEIPDHELLTAGFPCQPFSSAGKKKGVRDPRGTLFEIIINILRQHSPAYFILENVKRLLTMERGFHFATILTSLAELDYRIEWRLLNAMHLGLPQNRQRVFIIGTRDRLARPDPPRIRLATAQDLGELNDDQLDLLTDTAGWRPINRHGVRFPSWGIARSGRFLAANLDGFSAGMPVVPVRTILQSDAPPEFDFTETTLGWLASNTPVNRFVQGVEIISNQSGGARMGYTIFGINGVAPTLTSTTSRHYERYKIGEQYRRLTNVEYARIQGFPDDHCQALSVYDQYALFGNAVPPSMGGWVMDRIRIQGIVAGDVPRESRQCGLFDHAYQKSTAADDAAEAG